MSRSQVRQTRHELAPFFGNDGRADLFIKLFLQNNNVSINEANAADLSNVNLSTAYDIMKAQNYEAKQLGSSDTDLQSDFTDFIIDTALFHRALDVTTGAGNALQNFRQTLHTELNNAVRTRSFTNVGGGDRLIFETTEANSHYVGVDNTYALNRLGLQAAVPAGQTNMQKLLYLVTGLKFNGIAGAPPIPASMTFVADVQNVLNAGVTGLVEGLINPARALGGAINLVPIRAIVPGTQLATFNADIARELVVDLERIIINYSNSIPTFAAVANAIAYATDPYNVSRLSNLLENQIFQTISKCCTKTCTCYYSYFKC